MSYDKLIYEAYGYQIDEARKKVNPQRNPSAVRVRPGGAPILADVVALLFSRGKRGVTIEEIVSIFKAAPRTTRKWRQQLKDLRYAKYREHIDPDDKLRIFLDPVYDD